MRKNTKASMNLRIALKEIDVIYVVRGKSLTLACPLEAKHDLSNFNVFYRKIYLGDLCWIFAQPFLYILRT